MAKNQFNNADHYIDLVKHLPPAPTVAIELLGLFDDPDRDIDRIVELISLDPSLTLEVLKRCGKASSGANIDTGDMFEVVARLGFYDVYCVVAAVVGARAMSMGKSQTCLDTANLWRHSVATAVSAAVLAGHLKETEAVAFTAGLLHDIGKLVLVSVEHSRYADIINRTGTFGPLPAEAEHSTFGVSHAHVGARLLSRWGLPDGITAATLHHHNSPELAEPYQRLAAMINFANCLAQQIVEPKADLKEFLEQNSEVMAFLQLKPDHVPAIIAQIQNDMQRVEGLLGLVN
jgi:putative nucleotidyltransferase with HDIG domain